MNINLLARGGCADPWPFLAKWGCIVAVVRACFYFYFYFCLKRLANLLGAQK